MFDEQDSPYRGPLNKRITVPYASISLCSAFQLQANSFAGLRLAPTRNLTLKTDCDVQRLRGVETRNAVGFTRITITGAARGPHKKRPCLYVCHDILCCVHNSSVPFLASQTIQSERAHPAALSSQSETKERRRGPRARCCFMARCDILLSWSSLAAYRHGSHLWQAYNSNYCHSYCRNWTPSHLANAVCKRKRAITVANFWCHHEQWDEGGV